ncbi:MAG TPA: hypothetical protein VHV78_10375, partial [Gemmatimonadaceae bacterium]|nr:hypothetical protein [Gemmatimonadaceae bacterium]
VVRGFAMPVRVGFGGGSAGDYSWIKPTTSWKTTPHKAGENGALAIDPDFLVTAKDASAASASGGGAR